MGSAGPAEFGSGARFFPQTPEVSELEIALLFPLCVASFASFLFALSPRLYCEGVDEMGWFFEHASMCNQNGGVKIQNRGPEQEIPAVTCVRLIAQKHRY